MQKNDNDWEAVAAEVGESILAHLRVAALKSELSIGDILKLSTAYRTLVTVMHDCATQADARSVEVVFRGDSEAYAV